MAGIAADARATEIAGRPVRVTTAAHPGFGRVILDLGSRDYSLTRDGDHLDITLNADAAFHALPPNPPDVIAMTPRANGLDLTLEHGAAVHDQRRGTRLVIDIDDPVPPHEPAPDLAWGEDMSPPSAPIEPTESAPEPAPATETMPAAPPHADTVPDTPPEAVPDRPWPVAVTPVPTGPVALIAVKVPPPAGLTAATIQIPFSGSTGAAMFSRGPETWVLFDERRPIDLSGLRGDPVFGKADVTLQTAATVLHLTIPPGQAPLLSHAPAGWRISVGLARGNPEELKPAAAGKTLDIPADAPGQVITITDPQNGAVILAGTQRKPGQAIRVERRTAQFILPLTDQGVIVLPLSDSIGLTVSRTGFVLANAQDGLALSPPPPMADAALAAARLTRTFEFPAQTTEALAWRARRLAADAATTPPLARGPKRLALAECLIALGMGVEARTVLQVAGEDDPTLASLPKFGALTAIANLLAHRSADAGGLLSPDLAGTDETAMWRALQTALTDGTSPGAASILATTAPLLFTYPDELRHRFLPLAMETLIAGGQTAAAARLLDQRPKDPDLAFARAALKQAAEDQEGALKAFDALANTRSPLDHARAETRAVELRLAMGKIDDKAAAEALEKHMYAWRGDDQDLKTRERIAALDQRAGAWRAVFSILRGAKQDFPAEAVEIEQRIQDAFAALPRDASMDRMPPTELIGLLEENAELLGAGPEGEPMRERLAEKLMALDLPKRADPVLTTLIRGLPPGPSRAGFGATLAALRLREGDGDGALAALSESSSDTIPPEVRARRSLITAKVEAKRGHVRAAVESLSGVDTLESDETRAAVLESAKNWPAAVEALKILTAKTVPTGVPLSEPSVRTLLRLASAATHAGDDATLASLRQTYATRIPSGATGDMFRLLTQAPVRGTDDLARARAEIGLARAVTADGTPAASPSQPSK